jgi:hypothetical protein
MLIMMMSLLFSVADAAESVTVTVAAGDVVAEVR